MALYREKNQDPLLKLAGDYFSTLTCGTFDALVIDDVGNQRALRGVRSSNGDHLDLDAMSDGTRDQLFLALRLAYIETHCDKGTPCPVILDDVLMAFDDRRATAALRALRDLSQKTQVLVFTHHAHHVALAETVLKPNEYRLHDLASFSAAAQLRLAFHEGLRGYAGVSPSLIPCEGMCSPFQ
jgi:exonuclease SbcC